MDGAFESILVPFIFFAPSDCYYRLCKPARHCTADVLNRLYYNCIACFILLLFSFVQALSDSDVFNWFLFLFYYFKYYD